MTIKELKELIKDIPNDTEVILEISDDGVNCATSVCNTGLGNDGKFYIGAE